MITPKNIALLRDGRKTVLTDRNGLMLRRTSGSSLTWILRRQSGGTRVQYTLGTYPALGIADARARAREYLEAIGAGKEERDAATFYGLLLRWIDANRTRLRHPDDVERRMAPFLRDFGNTPFQLIEPAAVLKWFLEYTGHGSKRLSAARIIMGMVHTVEKIAVTLGIVPHRRLQGLNSLIPPPVKERMPSVDASELPDVIRVFREGSAQSPVMFDLFLTALYTLARPGEYSAMRWEWVDFEKGIITIPKEHMKMARDHRIPMTRQLGQLLRHRRQMTAGDIVFPSPFLPGRPVNPTSLSTYYRRHGLGGRLTPHGVRSTGRSWLAEAGVEFDIAELCLAHAVGSDVERRYNRTDLLERRREAMQQWCDYVESCVEASGK